ncbi:MAG TPA: polyprenyl synthetase family protein [Gammaproteobacteria bacterium]|nr:polyprenyl synthetase family protein [Gammaproteobacteria bacterium]
MTTLESIRELVQTEFNSVNDKITSCLNSEVDTICQIAQYILESGGKRLRPTLVLLSGKACNAPIEPLITLAAVIECMHTATLLHDDVVDTSQQRRGKPAANLVWSNPACVLVGDFLYSRCFQLLVSIDNMPMMHLLAQATNTLAEGEVLQLMNKHNPDITLDQYQKVIQNKTAKLFEVAASSGGVLAKQSHEILEGLAQYGMHLGTAFQLVDDLLDYEADPEVLGKNIGDDLAEGKATMPLIYALHNSSPEQADQIRQAIQKGCLSNLSQIQETIESTGAIQYTIDLAKQQATIAKKALGVLPPSIFKDALMDLASVSVTRKA